LKEWFVSELEEALATSTHDVQMVLNYMDTRGDLDLEHVGMVGQGSGGAVAILAASADPRIRVLDLLDPWGDWPDWLKTSKQIPEEPDFLKRVSGLDPVVYLPQLKGRAIRIQQVVTDTITPDAARDKIANAAPTPDEVTRYPEIATEAKALGADGIVKWLGEQLNPKNATAQSTR
jgi:cephalosporin-C deacetylase-like acetyl esterase